MSTDELTNTLTFSLLVSDEQNSTNLQHPRLDEFKGRYVKSGDQSNRRDDCLTRQKKKRFDAANYARKLVEGDLEEEEFNEVCMEYDKREVCEKKSKKFNPYKNQLMLSEWVVDPPDDLKTNWTMVISPVGKRVLVVASKGRTKVFSKGGYFLQSFPSLLPGGSSSSKMNRDGFTATILDCIFDEGHETVWMLDMMCYKGNPLYDCETDFRLFWLNTKLLEDAPTLNQVSQYNKYKFIPCINVPCDEGSIIEALTDMHSYEIDGVLFYHKLSHYQPGRTPLVGWLKPYMIPEILNIVLPSCVMKGNNTSQQFNKAALQQANEQLKTTTSDKSFLTPEKSHAKQNGSHKTAVGTDT